MESGTFVNLFASGVPEAYTEADLTTVINDAGIINARLIGGGRALLTANSVDAVENSKFGMFSGITIDINTRNYTQNLFIPDLPPGTTEEDVKMFFYDVAPVRSASIRGSLCRVEFIDPNLLLNAIILKRDNLLHDSHVTLLLDRRTGYKATCRGAPATWTEVDIRSYFDTSSIKKVAIDFRGCLITFTSKKDFVEALSKAASSGISLMPLDDIHRSDGASRGGFRGGSRGGFSSRGGFRGGSRGGLASYPRRERKVYRVGGNPFEEDPYNITREGVLKMSEEVRARSYRGYLRSKLDFLIPTMTDALIDFICKMDVAESFALITNPERMMAWVLSQKK